MSSQQCANSLRIGARDAAHKIVAGTYKPDDTKFFRDEWPCGENACCTNPPDNTLCGGHHEYVSRGNRHCIDCGHNAKYLHRSTWTTCHYGFLHECVCGKTVRVRLRFSIQLNECPYSDVAVNESITVCSDDQEHAEMIQTCILYERCISTYVRELLLTFMTGLVTSTADVAAGRFARNSLFDRNVLGIIRAFMFQDDRQYKPLSQLPECYLADGKLRVHF